MNQKIFINTILVIAIAGLFAGASLANAQAPTAVPTTSGGEQAPSIASCTTDCGSGSTCYRDCYKPVSPGVIVGSTATGQDSSFLIPSDGKCPNRYIVSDDEKNCLKIDAYSAPEQPVGPSVSGGGQTTETTVKPSEGKCPTEYVLSKDGGECLKPSVPTVFVPPTVAAPSFVFTSEKISVRDTATKKEINVAPEEGFKVVVDLQVPVAVQKGTNNTITISRNNVSVPVATGKAVQVEKGNIMVSNTEVKVMPDSVVTIVGNELKAETQSMKLDTEERGEGTAAIYKVEATRESRILGLFKVTMPIVASVNAQTAAVEKVQKPWWSFLAF